MAATLMLIARDRKLTDRTVIVQTALELFVDYARLSYQPNDKDDSHLARRVLAKA